jgi:hypothetical protein
MVALSTRFVGRFGVGLPPEEALDHFSRSGAEALVLDAGLSPAYWEREWSVPILAVEAPSPWTPASRAMLCSPDRDEAQTALEAALDTVVRAAPLGARFVGVWLGEVRGMEPEWLTARERFLRGQLDEGLARRLMQRRRALGQRALDIARRALDRLARTAESEGLTLAVANGRRFTALPDARELDLLLGELRGAPVRPLFDVASAHLPDVMGMQPFAVTEAAFGQAPLVYLGDACGPLSGLPPGRGQLELRAIAKKLSPEAELVFSPWSGLTVEESLRAVSEVARLR